MTWKTVLAVLAFEILFLGFGLPAGAGKLPPFDPNEGCNAPDEPSYCKPEEGRWLERFRDTSVPNAKGLDNLHPFLMNDVKLIGVGVGYSKIPALQSMATKQAQGEFTAQENDCTWYFRTKDKHAETFNNVGLDKPDEKSIKTYLAKLNSIGVFEDENSGPPKFAHPSFLYCAKKHKYIAMGCDGMRHRGPTVFGMMLAFSGCCAQHTFEIIDREFGDNGIKDEVRKYAFKQAYDFGKNVKPVESRNMRQLFGDTNQGLSTTAPPPGQPGQPQIIR